MRKIEIVVLSGVSSGDRFTYSLGEGDSVQVGRADSNDLVLSDPRISRTHCGILSKPDGLYLYDLGSAAGTVHMGFQLQSGEAGARPLANGDEFKIGDSLFRVHLTEPETVVDSEGKQVETSSVTGEAKRKKLLYAALAGGLGLLLLLFLLPEEKSSGLPRQRDHIVRDLPSYRLIGYWPGGRKTASNRKDRTHIDKAQFFIPASNHLIEYEYISEVPIEVRIDGVRADELTPFKAAWRRKQLVVRDVLQGTERKLIFDNLNYPAKKGKPGERKRWGVRNVRVTPIVRPVDGSVEEAIKASIALAGHFDKTPDGLFTLVRSLQRVALELLIDQSQDIVPVTLLRSSTTEEVDVLDEAAVSETLEAILSERRNDYSADMDARHLQAVVSLISRFDGELWRRVDSRIRKAKYSAEAKNSIVVYDNLMAVRAMFPDESDYRWVRANMMLNDKAYVPKKVRENPGRYRR